MALTRKKKEELLRGYAGRLARAQVMIWARYQGLRASQMEQLRGQLRPLRAEVVVIKNTLMGLALDQAGLPRDPEMMGGSCAVTFAYDEVGAATRAVTDFARANEGMFEVEGGLVGGKLADRNEITFVGSLPPRDILLAQTIASIQAPISGFVGVLAATIRGLMNVLNAHEEQLQGAPS